MEWNPYANWSYSCNWSFVFLVLILMFVLGNGNLRFEVKAMSHLLKEMVITQTWLLYCKTLQVFPQKQPGSLARSINNWAGKLCLNQPTNHKGIHS